MATYRIDFSTNASRVAQEIDKVNQALTEAVRTSKPVEIKLDDTKLTQQLNTTFKQLDKEIAKYERRLRKLPVGSPAFGVKASQIGQLEGERQMGRMTAQSIGLRAQAGAFPQESFAGLSREIQAAKISASMIQPNTEAWTNLQREIARLNFDLQKADKLAENIQLTENLGAFSPGSLNALEAKLTILRNRAREISPSKGEWKIVNAEIVKTEQAIERQTRRSLSKRERMGAAGGAFLYGGGLGGGVGSAVGGIAGGLVGGVPGAFTGAAIGQLADNISGMGAGAAKSASDIAQLQRGLALASIDANDFASAQEAIAQSSDSLALPLEQVYRQFTQLRVNTKEYGMSIKETQQIFEGIVLAVSSVGGSMEDVDGAMRAVVQIFSKGKVQAEELRGQLGERFPGAVVRFAQANKLSFEELQVALEQGKVTVGDFVEFAKKNYEDYAKFSEQIATAPEFAGRRLEKAMSDMQIAIGSALGPAGAAFQNFATEAIKSITDFVTQNRGLIIQVGKDFSVVFSGIANAASVMGQVIMKVLGPVYQYIGEVINRLRIMTGTATASTARAEMDAAFALMKKHGTGRTKYQQGGIGYMSDKIEYDKAAARYAAAEKQFKAAGGSAAMVPPTTPRNLTFGGPGAGIKLDAITGGKPEKEKKTRLTDYNSKVIEILRARLKEEKLAIETSDKLNSRQKELDIASKEYETGLKIIEEQLKQVRAEKGKMSEADAKLAMAEANQTAEIERSSLKYEYSKAVFGDLFSITEDYEEQIQKVTLGINALNTAKGEITKTQEAELALFEQLKGVKEEDIPLLEARKNKIMQLAGELDRLLGIEKEVRKEQELRSTLEAKRTEVGMIGAGLRAGFTGEAASVFERAMVETEGNVDYASQMANLETQAMQLRAVFEGIQGAIAGVSGAFANMLTEGVTNMITGTATAKEVFASFLQSVGQALSQAASQMIATYIAIGIAKMFAGLGGGGGNPAGSGGGISDILPGASKYMEGGGAALGASAGTFGAVTTGYANGGIAPGGFRAFANGGVVTGPTLGLVGEGKYNEAIVPLPDGKSIPVQLGGGSSRELLSGGSSRQQSASPILSMSFQTTKFGDKEYVDIGQLQAAMAETRKMAAREGASQGSQLALSKLRNSPSTRRQLGLG